MRYYNGNAVSGADKRQKFKPKKGLIVRFSGLGIFLSPNEEYVKTYYCGSNDVDIFLTFEINLNDITSGNLEDRESEITVSQAKLIKWEIIENEE